MYLQPGVGTDIKPGFWSFKIRNSILRKLVKFLDEAFALYLCQHVMAGYEFLVKYYNPGDEVYIFGSSALHNPDGGPHLTYWVSLQGSLAAHTPPEPLQQCYTRSCTAFLIPY